jgi:hypothetical protein
VLTARTDVSHFKDKSLNFSHFFHDTILSSSYHSNLTLNHMTSNNLNNTFFEFRMPENDSEIFTNRQPYLHTILMTKVESRAESQQLIVLHYVENCSRIHCDPTNSLNTYSQVFILVEKYSESP